MSQIHSSVKLVEELLGSQLQDIVPAYQSIAIFSALPAESILLILENASSESTPLSNSGETKIPICYELGEDLAYVANYCGMSEDTLIGCHLMATYTVAFVGFVPGFIYGSGLDGKLACPRKTTPRKKLSAGSVGIGGNQTGIYGLSSPGGWNIIGRTPMLLFDARKKPPLLMDVGSSFSFYRISQETFEAWGT